MSVDAATTMPQPRYWLAGGETLMRLLAERRELGEPQRTGRRPNAAVAVTLDELAVVLDDLVLLAGDGSTSPGSSTEWQARELLGDALRACPDDDDHHDAAALAAAWARHLPPVTDGAI